jgi:hypothetical protein
VSLSIRAIRIDEIRVLQDFVREHWNAEHAFVRSEKLLQWQHFSNPFKSLPAYSDEELSFLGAWRGNSLIAVLGEIPVDFTLRGRRLRGTWLALWKNGDEQRHPSAGIRLLHHITSGPAEFIGGIGMNPRVHRAYELFKFRVCDDLPLYLVLNPDVRSELIRRKPTWSRAGGERFLLRDSPNAAVTRNERALDGPVQADEWERFWSSLRRDVVAVERSFAYVDWRYLNHPHYDYEWLRIYADSGDLEAAGVYRVEPVGTERVIQVVECLGTSEGARRLAGALCGRMSHLEASFLGFRCAQTACFEPWREVGGAIYGKSDRAFEIPSLFQPVVPEYRPLAWGYRFAKAHEGVTPEDCYVTRSDGDQDRPSRIEW